MKEENQDKQAGSALCENLLKMLAILKHLDQTGTVLQLRLPLYHFLTLSWLEYQHLHILQDRLSAKILPFPTLWIQVVSSILFYLLELKLFFQNNF